jgi:type IV pilus assembly protein PilB
MIKKTTKNISALLLEKGVISQTQWEQAKLEERNSGEGIHRTLTRLGYVTEETMADFISEQMSIPRIGLSHLTIDPKIIDLVPGHLAQKYQVIPLFKSGSKVTCAMADVFNVFALDEISLKTGLLIEPAIATEKEIKKALTVYYAMQGQSEAEVISFKSPQDLPEMTAEAPVIKFVNLLIAKAVALSASDIHIEPEENTINVRYRIDGVLYAQPSPQKNLQLAINSRLKIMANLNISESRRPQDGRFKMTVEDKQIDIRLSCLPTVYGENLVLRVLNTSNILLGLEQIGFQGSNLENYRSLLHKPNGIILVTGPTGSGKTTTLYSSISTINNTEKSIYTTEDPVEYRLPGIRQTQVDPLIGLTFATGLRAILRQDPNIIMVGEIRDAETAQIAIQAALTGHLVMATLHTNSAAGAISRLIDIGVEPFLLASSIIGVVGQRLVRLICKDCRGKGCAQCLQTGYKGRRGIYELMTPNEHVRTLIMKRSSTEEIHHAAIDAGMTVLRENGMDLVAEGLTTKEEIFRVTE